MTISSEPETAPGVAASPAIAASPITAASLAIAAFLSAALLFHPLPAFADDAAYEQYSMEVGEAIANAQSSSEADYGNDGEETEADDALSPIHRGVDHEDKDSNGKLKIDSYHGYAWGTSLDTIQDSEVSDDLKSSGGCSLKKVDQDGNTVTDSAGNESLSDVLGLKGYQIAGYDATSFYVFEDKKLTGGAYEYFMSTDGFLDTVSQCTEAYGNPQLSKEVSGSSEDTNSNYAIWADKDGDFILAAQSLGVVYGQKGSSIIGMFSSGIEDSCGIDLAESIAKASKKT